MPAGMSRAAQAVWRRQTKAMALTGVLTVVDADALRVYCDAVARYAQAQRRYEREGPLVKGARSGELVKNPLHQIVRDNSVLIRQLARELGFVPGARDGITVEDMADQVDTLASWEASS